MTWCFRAIKPDKEFIEYCRKHLLDKQKAKNPKLEKIIDDIGEQIKSLKHKVGNLGYKIKNQRHEIDNHLKEIEKLKSLLKESRFLLSKTPCENMSQCLTFNDVINRIDQVLGEE